MRNINAVIVRNLRPLESIDRRTRVAAGDVEKGEWVGDLCDQEIVQLLIRLAVEKIVVVHHLAVNTPLSLKKNSGRTSRCGRRWLTSLDARVGHVITDKKLWGAEVNAEARGGSRQRFAQGTELGPKSR